MIKKYESLLSKKHKKLGLLLLFEKQKELHTPYTLRET